MSDIAATPPAAPPRHYFLTFLGTFLIGTDRDDWIAHAPLSRDTLPRLIFVEAEWPDERPEALLRKTREAPRRLPDFRREPVGADRQALRCIAARSNEGIVGGFMAAAPDGRVEIDRGEARDWEHYSLLSDRELDWLIGLMDKARPVAPDAAPFEWRFVDGFRISDGQHLYGLARLVRARALPDLSAGARFSLLDDARELVDVVI